MSSPLTEQQVTAWVERSLMRDAVFIRLVPRGTVEPVDTVTGTAHVDLGPDGAVIGLYVEIGDPEGGTADG